MDKLIDDIEGQLNKDNVYGRNLIRLLRNELKIVEQKLVIEAGNAPSFSVSNAFNKALRILKDET